MLLTKKEIQELIRETKDYKQLMFHLDREIQTLPLKGYCIFEFSKETQGLAHCISEDVIKAGYTVCTASREHDAVIFQIRIEW